MRINKIICDICKKEIDESNERWFTIKGSICTSKIQPMYEVHEECFLKVFGDSTEKDIPEKPPFVDCHCYHVIHYNSAPDRRECWGTKEREECTCGGNKYNCTFYKYDPEKDRLE